MEITGARTCAAAELVLQLESDWGPADDMQGAARVFFYLCRIEEFLGGHTDLPH